MTNVIQLLPESVVNQIAAGEVVQRPASVVKELIENALDAGATQIQLIVRDAGKTLIQVVDNGCGMSETDARMCFERHATSKIRDARDLFSIRTMGFRGEALASIAAVAQVELRTRRATDELGTRVIMEDGLLKVHEPCHSPPGTNIVVRNLFYNVPARRNFLKSDLVEMRHILDEFQHLALANPEVSFSLYHNEQELFHLVSGNLRTRIVKVFGEAVNKKLVPVREETEILTISGFVGKPDYFRKARGEQMFFVNRRYIKSAYLHHAVMSAYEGMLPPDTYPLYVLFIDIDPARIDVNVHPTKQEIKFDDERLVYNYLKVAVRHALGIHNVTPTLDFEPEPAFIAKPVPWPEELPAAERTVGAANIDRSTRERSAEERQLRHWQRLFEGLDTPSSEQAPITLPSRATDLFSDETSHTLEGVDTDIPALKSQRPPYQIHGQYIITHIKSGFLLIDQQAASERILFERYLEALRQQPAAVQQLLFPKNLELSPADAALLRSILPEVNRLGFDITEFGGNTFVIHGVPAMPTVNQTEETLLERLLDQYKRDVTPDMGLHERLASALARSAAVRAGQPLSTEEMQSLIDQLFACAQPYRSPSGRLCFITFELEDLQRRFAS
ncbi:MAG: DNA mismatch repair endonuclease MutL [Saprospiraceae bacterium]|nr:DNA mismatch repair endonuclease MutL [Saprospiraceae bacterium]MDW8483777.1 DNA mismatch repair endonuclease MutL [Saprospiraceae bacterium]